MVEATQGQAREFIGKLLVSLNDEKIAQIEKQKIQKIIDSLSSKDDTVVDNLIRFINNGCRLQIVGNHEIDTDQIPKLPFNGATIESHIKSGKMILDFSKLSFYLTEEQKNGSINGNYLRKKLKNKSVLNACWLDYLMDNPSLMPEDWKDKYVYFWGTIFRSSYGFLFVRCLYFNGDEWQTSYDWLGNDFRGNNPAIVSAS